MCGRLVMTGPGAEAEALDGLHGDLPPGSIILVGERLATSPGALFGGGTAGRRHRCADWPGFRGGPVSAAPLEAGCLPNAAARWPPRRRRRARAQVAAAWNVDDLPATRAATPSAILAAAADG